MKIIVLLDFKSSLSEAGLAQFAVNVYTRMKDNPKFAVIKPLIDTDLKDATDQYNTALQEAADRSRVKVAEKRLAQQRLLDVLETVAAHLNIIANNNEATVLEAGFRVRPRSQRSDADLEPVTGLSAQSTIPGQVTLRFNRVPLARMYSVEWRSDDEPNWRNSTYTTARRAVINNLASRREILLRVCALGSQQRMSAPCEPVRVFVM